MSGPTQSLDLASAPDCARLDTSAENDTPSPDWAVDALRIVRDQGVQLSCDLTGRPQIQLRDDPAEPAWPVRSQRVRDWIAKRFADERGDEHLLLDREIDRVLNVLAGEAWDQWGREVAEKPLWDLIEAEPVLYLTLRLMANKDAVTCTMTELLERLAAAAKLEHISIHSRNWPKCPERLGAILREYQQVLEQAGVKLDFTRSNMKRVVHLTKSGTPLTGDGPGEPPSVGASPTSPAGTGANTAGDGGDTVTQQHQKLTEILRTGRM